MAKEEKPLPRAQVIERHEASNPDPLRAAKIGGFVLAVLLGWVFVLWTNKFHVTAPVVMVCLGYLAVIATVANLWRTGAAIVAPVPEGETWGRPIGARGELEKEKRTLLKAIKEAEFDLAMGKLSKADSDSLIRQYRARAIDVIKELDRLEAGTALSPKEQIEREVRARIELAASDKPSNRAKNAVVQKAAKAEKAAAARAEKDEKVATKDEKAAAKADEKAAAQAEDKADDKAAAKADDKAAAKADDKAAATASAKVDDKVTVKAEDKADEKAAAKDDDSEAKADENAIAAADPADGGDKPVAATEATR